MIDLENEFHLGSTIHMCPQMHYKKILLLCYLDAENIGAVFRLISLNLLRHNPVHSKFASLISDKSCNSRSSKYNF